MGHLMLLWRNKVAPLMLIPEYRGLYRSKFDCAFDHGFWSQHRNLAADKESRRLCDWYHAASTAAFFEGGLGLG